MLLQIEIKYIGRVLVVVVVRRELWGVGDLIGGEIGEEGKVNHWAGPTPPPIGH